MREPGRYSKGLPVWKQQDGDHVLSYNDWKEWVVSREGNKDMAGIKTETMGSDRIPSSGWIIWVSERWKSDKELQVLGWLIFPSFLSLSMSIVIFNGLTRTSYLNVKRFAGNGFID